VDSGGLWLKQPDGATLDLRDMSDGFRSAAALVMDLMRHMVDVYGAAGLTDEQGAINHSGVVLIDEIDAHLHPEWQRKIGGWFKKLFPKIQFIVSTHSPLICQAADEGGIFHLSAPGTGSKPFRVSNDDYRKIIAGRPDAILLSPAFGLEYTRSPRAVEARREYSRLQAKQRSVALSKEERKKQLELELFVEEG
jgi:predicted ATP-binding protein involved in virulence